MFIQISALGDPAGDTGTDLRWVAGVRANLIGWGAVVGGAAYGVANAF